MKQKCKTPPVTKVPNMPKPTPASKAGEAALAYKPRPY